ncbi:hypothetical protein E4U34_004179 [Claviceps purpurea]|nr:hypothetical protein E4U12_006480 [Claviceps purpurea]KAG6128325.1 hypothetical protein E4U28_008313 [Claviceps purpurea]KAG6178799.1 hypothetical protein E4U27_003537 [Claviceps purpurea]KAG6184202.1 hypothetical protein E4U36_002160 [Claviceps purpurea]KAG6192932.1 hypothetical protein E4U10_003974 [Claviceps purpurea]
MRVLNLSTVLQEFCDHIHRKFQGNAENGGPDQRASKGRDDRWAGGKVTRMRETSSVAIVAPFMGEILSSLPLLAYAAPVADNKPRIDYDAIIVGGGPAGLAALSALARVRRNVLLVDSGEYRNAATRHQHDVLGYDGVTPAYYKWFARKQLSNYDTVTMTNGTISKILPQQNNTYFTVSGTYPDNKEITFTARKIVLATGLRDLLPDTPGVRENWGQGLYWCMWCDGHEHADQALGLLGPLTTVPGTVREVLSVNTDVIAFVNGTDTEANRAATEKSDPRWQDYLKLHNIQVENRTIAAIERLRDGSLPPGDPSLPTHAEHDLFRVRFTEGEPILRDSFLTSYKEEQHSSLGVDMGVKMLGNKLTADQSKGLMTNVPGVYAIGDCNSDNVTNVPHALFTGKRAGVYLHVQLERENEAAELAALDGKSSVSRRSFHEHARSLWDRMNGEKGDLLYAGSFDQELQNGERNY